MATRTTLQKITLVLLVLLGLIFIGVVAVVLFADRSAGTGAAAFVLLDSALVRILMGVLAVAFALCGVYLIVCAFSGSGKLKRVVLFSDAESTTQATAKVLKNLVQRSAKLVGNVAVKKVSIRESKYGLRLQIRIHIQGRDAEEVVDRLRCLVADSCKQSLGVHFSSIDFDIRSIRPKHTPNAETAALQAQALKEKRACSQEYLYDAMEVTEQFPSEETASTDGSQETPTEQE